MTLQFKESQTGLLKHVPEKTLLAYLWGFTNSQVLDSLYSLIQGCRVPHYLNRAHSNPPISTIMLLNTLFQRQTQIPK